MRCDVCNGGKFLQVGNQAVTCPSCNGSGRQYDPGLEFTYSLPIALIANQAINDQAILIQNSRPFRWLFAIASSTGAFSALVKDGGRGIRPFANRQIQNVNMWGTAQQPMPIVPYLFLPNSQILIDIANLTANPNAIELVFKGVELAELGKGERPAPGE